MAKKQALWSFNNLAEMRHFADEISQSRYSKPELRGKPTECLMVILYGNEIGLPPMTAIQNIIIDEDGSPFVMNDAAFALAQAHPDFVELEESWDEDAKTASCTITRKNRKPVTENYSEDDAIRSGMADKENYKKYPRRMYKSRARSYALHDLFPEVFAGTISRYDNVSLSGIEANDSDLSTLQSVQNLENELNLAMDDLRKSLESELDKAAKVGIITPDDRDVALTNSRKRVNYTDLHKYVNDIMTKLGPPDVDKE